MEITIELLEKKFEEYNEKYFDGKLRSVKIGLLSRHFKNINGVFEFEIDKMGNLRKPSIKLNAGVNWDEKKLCGVLLHEMIHLSVTQKYKKGKGHGFAFIKECKRVESQYGVTVWHCWMDKIKRKNISAIPLTLSQNIVSFIKFRIIQKMV